MLRFFPLFHSCPFGRPEQRSNTALLKEEGNRAFISYMLVTSAVLHDAATMAGISFDILANIDLYLSTC